MASTTRAARCVIAGCLIAFMACAAFADELAAISGRITDPHGLVVAGVKVDATNINTNITYWGESNSDGLYRIPSIPPGAYRVIVQKTGFAQIIKPGVDLHVQDVITLNFTMQVGSVSQSITVEGGAPLINTEGAAVSTVIDRNFVERLPLNGRSFNTLLQLTPGVVIAPANNVGGNPGQFSIAGQRTDANNFTVDGVSANFGVSLGLNGVMGAAGTGSAQAFSVLGGTSSLVSVEALQEFRIETSSFGPEFGRSPGGQVVLTTRSGTNSFHGGVYDYFRNDLMDANDWFANSTGKVRAPERHNDFGGFLGGPILRDKTFFFLSYEGARLRLPQSARINVPSAYARSVASAALAPFLNAFPQPDSSTITPGVFQTPFTAVYSNPATLNVGSVRVDQRLSDRFSLFGRYNEAPSGQVLRTFARNVLQAREVNTRTLTLGANMALTAKTWNAVRGNYSRQSADTTVSLDSFGGAVPLNPSLIVGSLASDDTLGVFSFPGGTQFLFFGPLAKNRASQMNFVDDVSINVGPHQLKIGADYRGIFASVAPASHQVRLGAPAISTFLSTGRVTVNGVSQAHAQFLAQALSLYGQDTWKATPRLSLTYGLRWEWSPAPSARGNTTLGAWANTDNPAQLVLAPSGTPLWNSTYTNFAPRIGVVYGLNRRGDFVVRAGWGLYYDLGVGQSANVATSFPNLARLANPRVSLPIANVTSMLPSLSLQPPYAGNIYIFSSDLKLPRSYEWSLALEKAFGRQVFTATYQGQVGRDLLRNEALPTPNGSFNPSSSFVFLTQNDATSDYDSLQLQYRRPLASRLQMLLNYTWSHALDNQSDDTLIGASNNIVSAVNDRSSSDFDVRHSFSGALTYAIPSLMKSGPLSVITRDWSVDTVIVARSGFPFNAQSFDFSLDSMGLTPPRPDLVRGQPLWIQSSTAPGGKSVNPAAFTLPPTVRQGNEGRNDIPGFGLTQIDLSIARKFLITEGFNLQFRADAFNILNHPNFTNPQPIFVFGAGVSAQLQSQMMLNNGLAGLNPLFQEGGPRSLQLSLRFNF